MEIAIYGLNEATVGQNMPLFQRESEQTLLLFFSHILVVQDQWNSVNFYPCKVLHQDHGGNGGLSSFARGAHVPVFG